MLSFRGLHGQRVLTPVRLFRWSGLWLHVAGRDAAVAVAAGFPSLRPQPSEMRQERAPELQQRAR